jgi:hypothetical protein
MIVAWYSMLHRQIFVYGRVTQSVRVYMFGGQILL